jgi:hypothetical protein
VARPDRNRPPAERDGDPVGGVQRLAVGGRDPDAVDLGGIAIVPDDAEGVERRGDLSHAVDRADGLHDGLNDLGLLELLRGQRLCVDEAGDERALLREVGDHLGADPGAVGGLAGPALGLAVDAQELGVPTPEADDEGLAVHVEPEVAIGDPAPEDLRPHVLASPSRDGVHDRGQVGIEVHARRLAVRSVRGQRNDVF